MAAKSAQEQFAAEQARLAVSQQYLARDDNPDIDPTRQDQLDRNRVPGQLGGGQVSPNSAARSREARADELARSSGSLSSAVARSLKNQPYATLGLAALLGIALGAIWKA